jgi:hypothetical protein
VPSHIGHRSVEFWDSSDAGFVGTDIDPASFGRRTLSFHQSCGINNLEPFEPPGFYTLNPAHLEWEVAMKPTNPVKLIPVFIIASTLSACATEDMASELSKPNYGRLLLNPDENVDSRLLLNGLYAPKPFGVSPYAATPYAPPCLTAEYRCSQRVQSAWSSFDP